jgi:deazaflavin-dependent oxidoreductase (nitroreductase family)
VTAERYIAPGRGDRLGNWLIRTLVRLGISVWGARELRVPGRTSGVTRSTVVNLLDLDGTRYLVAPRGTTEWVRNVRAAGGGELRVGRRAERFRAIEVADADKIPVLRAYLEKWAFEVGRFFEGITKDSSDADLAPVTGGFPVFVVEPVP